MSARFIQKLMSVEPPKAEGDTPVFRCADMTPDDVGDRILPGALKMGRFELNPVLYANHGHKHGKLPIGTCRVWEEGGTYFMAPRVSKATQEARDVQGLVEDGTIRTCSIGFVPLRTQPNEFGGEDVLEAELCEVSLVGLPANPNAVRVKSMTDEDLKTLRQMAADMAEMKARFTKAFPDEEPSSEDAPSPEKKDEEKPESAAPSEEEPEEKEAAPEEQVSKFLTELIATK